MAGRNKSRTRTISSSRLAYRTKIIWINYPNLRIFTLNKKSPNQARLLHVLHISVIMLFNCFSISLFGLLFLLLAIDVHAAPNPAPSELLLIWKIQKPHLLIRSSQKPVGFADPLNSPAATTAVFRDPTSLLHLLHLLRLRRARIPAAPTAALRPRTSAVPPKTSAVIKGRPPATAHAAILDLYVDQSACLDPALRLVCIQFSQRSSARRKAGANRAWEMLLALTEDAHLAAVSPNQNKEVENVYRTHVIFTR